MPLNTKIRLTVLCLSGFELYSRWVTPDQDCYAYLRGASVLFLHPNGGCVLKNKSRAEIVSSSFTAKSGVAFFSVY